MTNVFLVAHEISDDVLTVFAKNPDEALRLYCIWREHNPLEALSNAVEIIALTAADLEMEPQLGEAAATGAIGVGYFLDHHRGWVIVPADEHVLLNIAPPATSVSFYQFDDGDDGGELLVFATSVENAIGIYTVWNLYAYGDRGEYESVQETSRWLLTGNQTSLREDMDEGLTGVGSECEDGSWRIFPVDYEPPLRRT